VVQAGSPTPTSLSTVPFNAYLAIVALTADKIYITKTAVQLVGTITQSNTTPFGNYQGAPSTFSFGYTSDTPPKINNVIETVAGVVAVYSSAATGTFTITQPSGGGGGGGVATVVTIVVNGSTSATPTFQTTVNQLILDASASTSTNAGALTYAWTIPQGSPSAVISFPGGNTAKAFVQLSSRKSTYQFKLTVTDSTGASATVTITVQYL
jgi:hypothetical protein